MADLAHDTSVVTTDRAESFTHFTADISAEWAIWGPMGGYIASIALRAAGEHCGRARPASINANFLAAAAFAPVTVQATTLRTTRVATCVRVTVVQDERPVIEATVWGTDTTDGLEHHTTRRAPDVPHHSTLPSFHERLAAQDEAVMYEFWNRLDFRPTEWTDDWMNRAPTEPAQSSWYRFVDGPRFDEPWLDDTRLLILTDLDAWGAATNAHTGELAWFAPTIELTCRFLQPAHEYEWLLSWGDAPVGRAGLIGVESEVWSEDHRLLAIGGSTLLCRPAPTES
ncbi:MAG: thioesterase family protein [Acidimicrobiales bacterium]